MLQFTVNRSRDPRDESLRKLLEAHVAYQRMTAVKQFSLYFLAIVGAVIWVGAEWPAFLPPRVLDSALAVWVGLLSIIMLATVEQWLWHRRVDHFRREQQAKKTVDNV